MRQTTDGGKTWHVFSSAPLFALSFADSRHGIALAAKPLPQPTGFGPEHLLITADGGHTWTRAKLPCSPRPSALLDQVAMLSRRTAWVVCELGDPGPWNRVRVFASDDGARHWRAVMPKPSWAHGAFQLTFLSTRRGYYCSREVPFRSDDGGRHWSGLPGFGLDRRECHSLSFITPGRGFILARDFRRPNKLWLSLLRTTDGGLSWRRVGSWRVKFWPFP